MYLVPVDGLWKLGSHPKFPWFDCEKNNPCTAANIAASGEAESPTRAEQVLNDESGTSAPPPSAAGIVVSWMGDLE